MDWGTVLTTAASTGFATAIANQGLGWWRESRGEKHLQQRNATYLAIRLAVILEKFALDCTDTIADYDMYTSSGGHAGSAATKLPELSEYPDEDDWKLLNSGLLARTLTLRNEIILSSRSINFWYEIDDECVPQECKQQTGKCGYIAWEIAEELRKAYSLGKFDPGKRSWDVIGLLKPVHDEALAKLIKPASAKKISN